MKYCEIDGFRFPDRVTHCTACGALLVALSPHQEFSATARLSLSTFCCPNPQCSMLVAPPRTSFCALCGKKLEAISLDIWASKIARPAVESHPLDVLFAPSDLFRPVSEMGLSRVEAEEYLDQALKEKTGITLGEFNRWLDDAFAILKSDEADPEAAKAQAIESALQRQVVPSYAPLLVERLARHAAASGISASSTQPTVASPDAGHTREHEVHQENSHVAEVRKASLSGPEASKDNGHAAAGKTIKSVPEAKVEKSTPPHGGRVEATARLVAEALPAGKEISPARKETAGTVEPRPRRLLIFGAVVAVTVIVYTFLALQGIRRNVRPGGNPDANASVNQQASVDDTPASPQAPAPSDPASNPNNSEVTQVISSTPESPDGNISGSGAESRPAAEAALSVSANVDEVTLWIDNAHRGVISRSQLRVISLPPGSHVIRATRPGYPSWERSFALAAGERRTVSINLAQPESGAEMAGAATPVVPPQPSTQEIVREHQQRAERFFQQGQFDASMAEADAGLRLDPGNQPLRNLRGRLETAKRVLGRQSTIAAEAPAPARRVDALPSSGPREDGSPKGERGAQLISAPTALYPANAGSPKSATVWVEVVIDERGYVSSARAIRGPSELYQAALNSARQSRFRPALRNGQAVGEKQVLPIMFNPGR